MKNSDVNSMDRAVDSVAQARLGRRSFVRSAGMLGLGAAALSLGSSRQARAENGNDEDENESAAARAQEQAQSKDTVAEIFTAALIAEDLATTFYYHALTGPVIHDVNLAGPGGTAITVSPKGNLGNVAYVRAALTEEISHANLFRSLLGIPNAAKDPVQTFYFPTGTFDTLGAFTGLLDALENAFIGAYLNAIQEFATKAARQAVRSSDDRDDYQKYTAEQLEYFAKVAASIMGVEAEHRVLGRVISNSNPANNVAYEKTDGLNAVYNGPKSAVAALTPFLTPSTGPGYSLASALANEGAVSLPVAGKPPVF